MTLFGCCSLVLYQAHEDLDKSQAKLRHEQRVGSNLLQSTYVQVHFPTMHFIHYTVVMVTVDPNIFSTLYSSNG